jgi:spore coat protein SA
MPNAKKRNLTVAVLLCGREKFSTYFGGALARWTYEVYSRLKSTVDVTVFGFPTATQDLYSLPHVTHSAWRACDLISKVPRIRRYEDRLWLRALFPRLRTFEFIHIHNRPQWARILRDLGYENRIILHLQNDHLGHWTSEMLDELDTQLNAIVTCSDYLRNTFTPKSKALANKTTVIFNGVNTELFHPRENLRESQTICFVGRFHPEKGILQLVQAYARVLRNCAEAKLVIGGTTGFGTHTPDPYVREVEAVARSIQQADSGKIQFTGYLHHERDLPGWFQRATLFASPSIFQEPFGLVNAEAMACATPVVGARRGGIPEVLGDSGVLVNPEDIQELAEALSTLLGEPAYAAQLGSAACQRAQQMFDWSVVAQRWSAFLTQLMHST